jgi:diaminobutyrate-2-oxoglutarate transaminase
MEIFKRLESEVRGYCRSYPTVFTTARGAELFNEDGDRYIDLLAGAGTLNYGHNPPALKQAVVDYLQRDGVLHGLDMHTAAKREFLEVFDRRILFPMEMDYKVQFTGPTGTNAVEAALKLARKITGRTNVVSFTNGFHGVSLGSVAATGNSHFRDAAGVPLGNTTFMPYAGYFGDETDTLGYLRKFIEDNSSGLDLPAAIIVETVQGEGGVNVASFTWLQELAALCEEFDILMIVDDIQVGCGRTGCFFSFEEAGVTPDIITLSKSLSGYGLPFSLVLMKAELDQWKPGEHNGTFRGNNLAFVSATAALRAFWSDTTLTRQVKTRGWTMRKRLERIANSYGEVDLEVRGRGMIQGISCRSVPDLCSAVSAESFARGLIVETSGAEDHVLKLLPPLTIDDHLLDEALDIIEASFEKVLSDNQFLCEHNLEEAAR